MFGETPSTLSVYSKLGGSSTAVKCSCRQQRVQFITLEEPDSSRSIYLWTQSLHEEKVEVHNRDCKFTCLQGSGGNINDWPLASTGERGTIGNWSKQVPSEGQQLICSNQLLSCNSICILSPYVLFLNHEMFQLLKHWKGERKICKLKPTESIPL